MNKPHEERFPPRCYLDPAEFTMECEDFAAVAQLKLTGIADVQYLSLTEHQHILAEKEKRIERLREALDFYANREPIFYESEASYYEDADAGHQRFGETARAALQEETK